MTPCHLPVRELERIVEAGLWASRQAVDKGLQGEGLEWRVHASGTRVNGIKLFLSFAAMLARETEAARSLQCNDCTRTSMQLRVEAR